jgi:hypothetical protein
MPWFHIREMMCRLKTKRLLQFNDGLLRFEQRIFLSYGWVRLDDASSDRVEPLVSQRAEACKRLAFESY